jgi:4-hydroxybenzoate polyprenyltransferase
VNNNSRRGARLRAFVAATHFPQALTMVVLMTVATALCGAAWWSVALVLLASAAGQATVGWTNDVFDATADEAAGRVKKPTVRGDLRPEQLRVPLMVSASLTIPLSLLAAGWVGGAAHIAAVGSALGYNFYLARTVWSWAPYALSFALMTVFIAQAIAPTLWPTLPLVSLSVIVGVVAHLLNAIPDIGIDRAAGWGGFAVTLGRRRALVVVVLLAALAALSAGAVASALVSG